MKTKWCATGFLLFVLFFGIQLHAQQAGGRYEMLSTKSEQYAETYMLDKQSGRIWMMRGQVSQAPLLIPCVYEVLNGNPVLSPLDMGPPIVSVNDRFSIKSATSGQYADTCVLDKLSGRIWMMRGQVSQAPFLIPCAYQLSDGHAALSPIDEPSVSVPAIARFSITCVTSGQYAETYVNDMQNGGVWMLRGQVSKTPHLIPCEYQLLNGNTATVPMERHSEINLLPKNAGKNGTLQDSHEALDAPSQFVPQKLPPNIQKQLDESSKTFDQEMNKLFPQGATNNTASP